MTYEVLLDTKAGPEWFYDSLLDGIVESKLLLHTRSDYAERLGLCDKCYGAITHIISNDITPNGYTNKYCPVLFHDLIKPEWSLSKIAGYKLNKELSMDFDEKRPLSGEALPEENEEENEE